MTATKDISGTTDNMITFMLSFLNLTTVKFLLLHKRMFLFWDAIHLYFGVKGINLQWYQRIKE